MSDYDSDYDGADVEEMQTLLGFMGATTLAAIYADLQQSAKPGTRIRSMVLDFLFAAAGVTAGKLLKDAGVSDADKLIVAACARWVRGMQ